MESEEELTNVELLASLSDEEDQHWMHRKRRNGELFLPTESVAGFMTAKRKDRTGKLPAYGGRGSIRIKPIEVSRQT
nr:hypothetical protein BaRGS_034910 [Batillaria attramentaria]